MSTAEMPTSTRHVIVDTPIGPLTLVRDDDGLTGLYYPGHWTRPGKAIFGPRVEPTDDPGFDTGKLTRYAGGLDRQQYLLELEMAIPVAPQPLW